MQTPRRQTPLDARPTACRLTLLDAAPPVGRPPHVNRQTGVNNKELFLIIQP